MRKIIFISLLATLFIAACKKETLKIEKPEEIISAPSPCSGNTWLYANQYQNNDISFTTHTSLVYDNKLYKFAQSDQLVGIYDGTSWTTLSSDIPVGGYSFSFTIGNKGYISIYQFVPGSGTVNISFYEYDFINNTWAQKAVFPGNATHGQASFTIGQKGYVAGGENINSAGIIFTTWKQTWEYNPQNDTWTQKEDLPNFWGRAFATGFSIGNKGYIVNGYYLYLNNGTPASGKLKSLLQYDPVTDDWNYKTAFPGQARYSTNVFVLYGVAYAGGGSTGTNDFYKYNPGTNAWTPIASPPVVINYSSNYERTHSLNGKGYLLYSKSGYYLDILIFKYTPQSCITVSLTQ